MSAPLHCARASSLLGSAGATGDGDADGDPAMAGAGGAARLHPLVTPSQSSEERDPAARVLHLTQEGLSPDTIHCTGGRRRGEGPGPGLAFAGLQEAGRAPRRPVLLWGT